MTPGPQADDLHRWLLNQQPHQRNAFLSRLCGDTELRREIEEVLGHSAIRASAQQTTSAATVSIDANFGSAWTPDTIGRYRIIRLAGEGGMGVVYEAEQEQPRRIVALKIIKPGWTNPDLLRRFEQESQALGRLHHPGIAQVYEAGGADAGFGPQPFFAMEFIRGESLRDYARSHRLGTRPRLELMIKVCEAVHHAHQRGITHRDLKPGNILVEESGQPKILDFGLARITGADAQATQHTGIGQLVGTLAYMSPEQVLADPWELDTRTDVYSLGVILYELLAGNRPYQLSNKLHEAARTIREQEPKPLGSVRRSYRGDLETIVAKSLEKDKHRRYGSAADLAADLRRYLADEPIAARPANTAYQLRKFAVRHKGFVASTAIVFTVLVAGILVSTGEAIRARTAEQSAKAVTSFLQNDLLEQAGASAQARPSVKPDADLKVRTALDRAAARIDGKFPGQPLVEASVRQTMSHAYRDLGLIPESRRQIERVIDTRRRALGETKPETLSSRSERGQLLFAEGKYADAETELSNVLNLQRRVLGESHPDTLNTMDYLGYTYRDDGKLAKAEPLLAKALDLQRKVLGDQNPDTLSSMNELAQLYDDLSKYSQAEPLYRKALEIRLRNQGEEHPDTLTVMNNLAALYYNATRYVEAEGLFVRVLDIRRRVLGPEHPDTLTSMNNLGSVYHLLGKDREAEQIDLPLMEFNRRVKGPEHPDTLISQNNLGQVYRGEGRFTEAESLFTSVLQVRQRVLGKDHPSTANVQTQLADLYRRQGKYQKAEAAFSAVADVRRRVLGLQNPSTAATLVALGRVRLEQRKFAEAEPPLREAEAGFAAAGVDQWIRFFGRSILGASLSARGRYADAEPLLLGGYQGMIDRLPSIPAESRDALQDAGQWIVQLYNVWGKPAVSAEWAQKISQNK